MNEWTDDAKQYFLIIAYYVQLHLDKKKSVGLFHLLPLFGKTEQPEKQ